MVITPLCDVLATEIIWEMSVFRKYSEVGEEVLCPGGLASEVHFDESKIQGQEVFMLSSAPNDLTDAITAITLLAEVFPVTAGALFHASA